MTLYRFDEKDKLVNYLNTKPKAQFFVYDSEVVYNKQYKESGSFTDPTTFSDNSEKNLYELNVDRNEKIYPFVTKDSSRSFLSSVITKSEFNSDFDYGDDITGSYPLTSSIARDYYTQGESRTNVDALQNTLNHYRPKSKHYSFSSSLGDKSDQELNLISIPSVFYGDRIKSNSLQLDFYISGTLMGRLEDTSGDGLLVQTAPSGSNNSGSVGGVCLYREGFVVLTGSWDLDIGGPKRDYIDDTNNQKKPAWVYFGAGIEDSFGSGIIPSSSFDMRFRGKNQVSTLTMFAKAPKGQLNYSQNPTYVEAGQSGSALTSSKSYYEPEDLKIANVVSASYSDPTGSFEKTTFINKIAIYDENKRLLGVAKTSRPVKNNARKGHMFKLKVDLP